MTDPLIASRMIIARDLFTAIMIIAAMVATIGAAALQPAVMGVVGIVAAAAAIVCGLLSWLTRDVQAEPADRQHPIGDPWPAHLGPDLNVEEDELHYVPVKDGQLPVWDTDIWGAVE